MKLTPLTVVAVHEVAASYWTGNPITLPADEPSRKRVGQAAEEAVAKVATELGESRPPSVTVRAVSGFVAEELIAAYSSPVLGEYAGLPM